MGALAKDDPEGSSSASFAHVDAHEPCSVADVLSIQETADHPMSLARLLVGRPLATEEDHSERVGALTGVGILGLDALGSAAYGPEALLTILLPLGRAGLNSMTALTVVIIAILGILGISYRQTIDAYPSGGGAYTVAKENLGQTASLFAAAALALDYLLNVAVAISSGVGALVSAAPSLLPHTLPICLGLVALLTLFNLRGVRTTGLAFMAPTYLFVLCLAGVLALGAVQALSHGGYPTPIVAPRPLPSAATGVSLWLVVRAFANGCTAMTGVEAVSNGVPIFKEPSVVHARRTLTIIIVILMILLAGIALLCRAYGVTATPPGGPGYESVLSQLTAAIVGRGTVYYLTIGSIIAVLALSANTSFADFPRVCRMLAGDRFLPESFVHRGRRLTFSHGILVLAAASAVLLILFRGVTDRLIPLFAIGALFAFTMSQIGMVAHWRKRSGGHARRALGLNLVGATATALTLCAALVSKFEEGAWISVLFVVATIALLRRVRRHYDQVAAATAVAAGLDVGPPPGAPIAVVPVRRWDAVALKALKFAIGITDDVIAVQVITGDRDIDDLTDRWNDLVTKPARAMGIKEPILEVRRSKYRQLFGPLADTVVDVAKRNPDRQIALVVPQLVEARWYHYLLHNHAATVLKTLILLRGGPQIVIITTPWYLASAKPERRRLFTAARFAPRR
jgi:amino acid transporter